ncbi:MAG: hypothetical protein PPP55_10145 [Halorubrum sp.]
MPRVPSDDESVAAIRVDLARSGATRRPCVRLPDDADLGERVESGTCDRLRLTAGDLVRVVIDREERYARVASDSRGRLLRGAFDDRRRARTDGEGQNRLVDWLESHDCGPGDVVVLDVVVPGELYGLRIPGERTVYDATRGPRSSLADIARDLDDR